MLFFAKEWKHLASGDLNFAALSTDWPQTLAVILNSTEQLIPSTERKQFKLWVASSIFNIKPVDYQSYFIGVNAFGSKAIYRAADQPLKVFSRWGFYASDSFVPAHKLSGMKESSQYSKEIRMKKIADFLKGKSRFFLKEFLEYTEYKISIRQAQRDFAEVKRIKKCGNTKNTWYLVGSGVVRHL